MTILLTALHLFVCVFLILVVLLQTGKGADLSGAFGGSSQTAFGARGATTVLSKLTTGSAILFMITSFSLAMLANSGGSSVVTDEPAQQSAPVVPGTPPATAPDTLPVTSPDSSDGPSLPADDGSGAPAETQQDPAGGDEQTPPPNPE